MTIEVRRGYWLVLLCKVAAESQDFAREKVTAPVSISCTDLARLHLYRLEKNDGKLPTSAPADEQAIPTIAAIINSKGHRLCEVGSLAVSTTTRVRTAAGTAAPTPSITATRRALPNARAAAARTATTSRPAPYNVSGSETFA